ncbi:MAG: hypothetical protein ACKO23_10740, partial [Gemmataceae bacterium]
MARELNWFFRPMVWFLCSMIFVGAAILIVFQGDRTEDLPQAEALKDEEEEIAWVYPATNAQTWERFVESIFQAVEHCRQKYPSMKVDAENRIHPASQKVPQVSISFIHPDLLTESKLIFRWYKLTSEWTPTRWIQHLVSLPRPPKAIIAGSNSSWAHKFASELQKQASAEAIRKPPLLFLTTATADQVFHAGNEPAGNTPQGPQFNPSWEDDSSRIDLNDLYSGRTFRFCFTNRQIANRISRFVWSRVELRPESDPAILVNWMDDEYSRDLSKAFAGEFDHRALENHVDQWGFLSGVIGLGLPPAAVIGRYSSGFRHDVSIQLAVDSSVGSFAFPNSYEAKAVQDLVSQLPSIPQRSLLVLTGQQQPCRRFLRDLARSSPSDSRKFLVLMGDTLSLNAILRDRRITWPIQDLPFPAVAFAHRNPVDTQSGFNFSGKESTRLEETDPSSTDDLLLYRDIVEACVLSRLNQLSTPSTSEEWIHLLDRICFHDQHLNLDEMGRRLFSKNGKRASGSGEHLLYVRPEAETDRIYPRAIIEVWRVDELNRFKLVGSPMRVPFNEFE